MAGNELTVQTTLPSIGKLQRSMANEQNIMSKAARLVPDTNTFLKTIMDKDIHTADSNAAANAMQTIAGDYLGNYAKDPFYAFTKKGRRQTAEMQGIVNNPMFKQMEIAKKQNDKEIDRVRGKGLMNEMVIDDHGRMAVVDREGNRSFKYASEIDTKNEYAVNVNDDHAFLDRREGGRRIAAYDVQSVEDTENQIRNTISKLGTAKWKNETDEIRNTFAGVETGEYGVTNVREREDNIGRINGEIERLQASGLSPLAMKSLYSTYYRNNPQEQGAAGAEDRAKQWAFEQVSAVALGGRITKDFRTSKKGLLDDGSGSGGSTASLQVAQGWEAGVFGTVNTPTLAGKYYTSNQGKKLLNMHAFSGEMSKDEHGRPIQMTRIEDTPISGMLNMSKAKYAVAADNEDKGWKAGDLRDFPKSALESGAFVYDPESSFTMYEGFIDNVGNLVSAKKAEEIKRKLQYKLPISEAERVKYLTPENAIRTGRVVEAQVLVSDEYGTKTIKNQDFTDDLSNGGYTSTEENARELNARGGVDLDVGNKLFAYDDNAYRVKVVFPANEDFFITGAGFAFDDNTLMDKRHAMVQNQKGRTSRGKAIATPDNAVQTGNTGQEQGYYNINSLK